MYVFEVLSVLVTIAFVALMIVVEWKYRRNLKNPRNPIDPTL
jgi:hypothetical protein